MGRTIANCRLIRKAIRQGEGEPEKVGDLCYGYGYYLPDGYESDEPCETCKHCRVLIYNKEAVE